MINHSRLNIAPEDVQAVAEVVASGNLAQGDKVKDFEKAVAKHSGVPGGVAVHSGTAALHFAMLAMDIGPGDEVVLPSYVCVAPLNAVRYTGATPVLADIDPVSGNIAPQAVARCLTPHTKAVIAPHLFGHPADITGLLQLGIPVIEDLAQAIGGSYNGAPLGSLGTVAVCSFYATKVMTTGEGGMVLSHDKTILEKVRDLRDYDEKEPYKLRYNSKMTDMQAALGLSQLRRLDGFIANRRAIAAFYQRELHNLAAALPPCEPEDIFYRYVIQPRENATTFIKKMEKKGVICRRPIFKPLHCLLGRQGFPATEKTYENAVSIPLYPDLTREEQKDIVNAVRTSCSQ